MGVNTVLVLWEPPPPAGVLAAWLGAFAAFGGAFWVAASALATPRAAPTILALASVQSASALALLHLTGAGSTGVLLLLVAGEVALLRRPAVTAAFIAAQTLGFAGLFAFRLPFEAAAFGVGVLLAFQLFTAVLCWLAQGAMRARRELLRTHAELRATRDLLAQSSRIAERLRIARELHDLLGHRLTAMSLQLEVATHVATGERGEHVRQAQALARALLADLRTAVTTLREGPDLDLEAALRALVAEIPCPRIHLSLPAELGLDDPQRAQALLRCVQEVVTNAVRHAEAGNLWIEVRRDGAAIEVRARDDGRGAAEVRPGSGLGGLRERLEELGGRLEVETRLGHGFEVRALVPRGAQAR